MKVYKLTNKCYEVGTDFFGSGMAIIIANNEEECIEVMNQNWCDSKTSIKDWTKENSEITELPLIYTGGQTEPFILEEEWYND